MNKEINSLGTETGSDRQTRRYNSMASSIDVAIDQQGIELINMDDDMMSEYYNITTTNAPNDDHSMMMMMG